MAASQDQNFRDTLIDSSSRCPFTLKKKTTKTYSTLTLSLISIQ